MTKFRSKALISVYGNRMSPTGRLPKGHPARKARAKGLRESRRRFRGGKQRW